MRYWRYLAGDLWGDSGKLLNDFVVFGKFWGYRDLFFQESYFRKYKFTADFKNIKTIIKFP